MTAAGLVTPDGIIQWLRHEVPIRGPAWLNEQRWFGGKGRTIERVAVEDAVFLPNAAAPSTLVVLRVIYGDRDGAASERYAIVFRVEQEPAGPVLGTMTGGHAVVESASDGPTLLALLSGLARETPIEGAGGGSIVYADATEASRRMLSAAAADLPRVKPLSAEQSNSSARIGPAHVFKLFRRVEPGEHPELEMGRFLTRVGFGAMPALEGSLVYRDGTGDAALGVLQGWVENQGDGWSYALGTLEQAASGGVSPAGLVRDLAGLGGVLADFHAALASSPAPPAFAPEPVSPNDEREWRARIGAQALRTFTLVERRRQSWTEPAASLAATALEARSAVARLLDEPVRGGAQPFMKIRIHGDFHLGQTLKTGGGFVLIDFEGEPAKTLAERRSKQCALRDVAGLLRSIDYAVASVSQRLPGPGPSSSGSLRDAFLEGYRARALLTGASFLPADEGQRDMWLALFELEKALYEIDYEVNNRPSWVHIPLRALCRLAG